jgi:hypothetical protein
MSQMSKILVKKEQASFQAPRPEGRSAPLTVAGQALFTVICTLCDQEL